MYHRHFETIDSTQLYLKDHIEELQSHDTSILISCSNQINGIGRTGNQWHFLGKSLAMSFTIAPHFQLTLTPLEIGILTCQFFNKSFGVNLFLKWPNDIMSLENKKTGGIITHFINSKTIIVGIGINIGDFQKTEIIPKEDFRHGIDLIKINENSQLKLSRDLYEYILKNRIESEELVQNLFNQKCCHLNRMVTLSDSDKKYVGKFIGIDKNGAAVLSENKSTYASQSVHISGSLTIN